MKELLCYLCVSTLLVCIASYELCFQAAYGETRVWWEALTWLLVWCGAVYTAANFAILAHEQLREEWIEEMVGPILFEEADV